MVKFTLERGSTYTRIKCLSVWRSNRACSPIVATQSPVPNSTRPNKGLPAPLTVEVRIVVLLREQTEIKLCNDCFFE